MSGLFSSVANYSGRQGDNTQDIKQFVVSGNGSVPWIYKKIPNSIIPVITPADKSKTVLIPRDLLVLGSINNPSDLSLKENIEKINNSDDILNLDPIKFQFINDSKHKKHYGFGAQDLEKIYPELVSDDTVGYKTVNYIELIPIILSKMKSMQNEIDKLKEEIKEIKENKNN